MKHSYGRWLQIILAVSLALGIIIYHRLAYPEEPPIPAYRLTIVNLCPLPILTTLTAHPDATPWPYPSETFPDWWYAVVIPPGEAIHEYLVAGWQYLFVWNVPDLDGHQQPVNIHPRSKDAVIRLWCRVPWLEF